jgi:hypothetical protein
MSATPLRMVIGFIGTVLLSCVVGIIVLSYTDHAIPDVLQNVAVGALTGLVGVLVPSRTNDQPRP